VCGDDGWRGFESYVKQELNGRFPDCKPSTGCFV
jgi:hypothetical protein